MAELGKQQGVLDEGESNILHNLLRFNNIVAENVMTPRPVMISGDEQQSIREFHDTHPNLRFSRIPVYSDTPDHITGYVLKDDILKQLIVGTGDEPLSSVRRDILVVKEDFPIPELFGHFTEKREQVAIVMDHFGGTAGLVSMEDVIETLLGLEIVDEQDNAADMQVLARRQWEERARSIGLIESDSKGQDNPAV